MFQDLLCWGNIYLSPQEMLCFLKPKPLQSEFLLLSAGTQGLISGKGLCALISAMIDVLAAA